MTKKTISINQGISYNSCAYNCMVLSIDGTGGAISPAKSLVRFDELLRAEGSISNTQKVIDINKRADTIQIANWVTPANEVPIICPTSIEMV